MRDAGPNFSREIEIHRRVMARIDERKQAVTAPPYATRVGRIRLVSELQQRGRARSSLLRSFADRCEPVRTAINRRRKQVAQSEWRVVRVDEPNKPPDRRVVDAMTKLLRYVNDSGLAFSELIAEVVEDVLVLDAGCIEKELTLGGNSDRTGAPIHALWPVDGAMIEIDPSWVTPKNRGGQGCDPTGIRYRQRDPRTGKIEAELRDEQLIYLMQNPTTHRILGFSQVEMCIAAIERALYGEQYAFDLIRNPVPPGLLVVPGLAGDPLTAFRTYYNEELDPGEVPIVGTEPGQTGTATYARTAWSPQDVMFDEYRKWLVNIIAFVFEIDKTIFGLIDDVNRSNGEVLSQRTDEGYVTLAKLVASVITREIVAKIDENHGFEFIDLVTTDPLIQAQIDKVYLAYGVLLPNEKRADFGRDPIPGGDVAIRPSSPSAVPDPNAAEPADPAGEAKRVSSAMLAAHQAMLRFRAVPSPSNLAAWEKAQAIAEAATSPVPFRRSGNTEREDALRASLHALIERERTRLNAAWDRRKILVHQRAKELLREFNPEDFTGPLDGLAAELVNDAAYKQAVNLGRKTVPGVHRDDADPVVDVWINHVQQYAKDVPDRLAGEIADAANAAQAEEDASVQSVLDRIDAKLEAIRGDVTRYAEPPWGAGWNGYGAQLGERNILMDWVLDDSAEHCEDCPSLADGSPYEQLPTWPAMGETRCADRCRCEVRANQESWDQSLGDAA